MLLIVLKDYGQRNFRPEKQYLLAIWEAIIVHKLFFGYIQEEPEKKAVQGFGLNSPKND